MTSPGPPTAHQDPSPHDGNRVSIMEHVTTVIASLDRRFDTLHQDLKEILNLRFSAVDREFRLVDLQYQQRYDAQQVALKDALTGQDKAVAAALTAAEKAVTKAETAAEKRFDSVNEFRAQLSDQAATFMPRSEAEAQYRSIIEKIDDLKEYRAAAVGREAAVPNTAKQIQDIADQVQALRDYREMSRGSNLETRVKELADQLSANSQTITAGQGRSAGLTQGWAFLVGAIGVFATIIAIVFALTGK